MKKVINFCFSFKKKNLDYKPGMFATASSTTRMSLALGFFASLTRPAIEGTTEGVEVCMGSLALRVGECGANDNEDEDGDRSDVGSGGEGTRFGEAAAVPDILLARRLWFSRLLPFFTLDFRLEEELELSVAGKEVATDSGAAAETAVGLAEDPAALLLLEGLSLKDFQ